MWQLIRANRRRSIVLISTMALILVFMGFVLGEVFVPGHGLFGAGIAVVLWTILFAVAMSGGDALMLHAAGAREIEHTDVPQLFNIVEEMKIASGLEVMPKVYVIDDPVPNAFAVGRKKNKCAVAVSMAIGVQSSREIHGQSEVLSLASRSAGNATVF